MYKALHKPGFLLLAALATPIIFTSPRAALAQESIESGQVEPMGQWLEYRQLRFDNEQLLVHLRTGYERAIILPEPVVQSNDEQTLPGTEFIVNGDTVAFYPTRTFQRRSVVFVGLDTGTVYDLGVRASPDGFRQPLRIHR